MKDYTIKFHFFDNHTIGGALIKARLGTTISHVGVEFGKRFFHASFIPGMTEQSLQDQPTAPLHTKEITVPAESAAAVVLWIESQLGKRYDFTALLGFIFARKFQKEDAFFCSEVGRIIFEKATGVDCGMVKLMAPHELMLAIDVYNQTKNGTVQ